ncbi:MAG: sugar phosphate isomerase/epimerase family protein [Candidatus Zipacnadales bacterium]
MKPSLHGVILGGGLSFEEQVAVAARAGFEGIDTGIEAIAHLVDTTSLEGAREFFAQHGVQPAVWGLPVNWREDEDTFRAGLSRLPEQAKLAQALGCPRCCTWIPPTAENPTEMRRRAITRFVECAKVLDDYGCRLGLEWVGPKTSRMGKPEFLWRMDQLLDMEADMGQPNIGLLVDSFHWFTAGHTQADLEALPVEKIVHVHLNDAPDKPRDEQLDMERLLPGEGIIDLKAFLTALKNVGYLDYMGIETFSKTLPQLPPDEAAAKAKAAADRVLAGL